MEEMESITTQVEPEEAKPEPSRWYEGHISLEDAKTFIKSNITTAARSFIAIGFYLKCVRDRELFKEENYGTVWEFAKEEYGISKSTASRYMSMNDRFSENGNSPNVQEEYRAFDKSKLQEMLYLEDEQLKQVTPEYRVEDIRNLRKPKEIPYIELPGQMDFEIDFPAILPPDQAEQPFISQKQSFEMNVEDMLSGEEQKGIAISQQETGFYNPDDESMVDESYSFAGIPKASDRHVTMLARLFVQDNTKRLIYGGVAIGITDERIIEMLKLRFSARKEDPIIIDNNVKVSVAAEIIEFYRGEEDLGICLFQKFCNYVRKQIDEYVENRLAEEKTEESQDNVIKQSGSVPEESKNVPESSENVIDGKYVEVAQEQELSAQSILEEEKAELQNWIKAFQEEGLEMPPMVERQKIIVAALTTMVEHMEAPEPVKQEQPELLLLKNNDQRAAFIDDYETWPIWIDTKETGERYYRYDLSEKAAIVIKVYWKHSWESYKESKDYEYGAEKYYLMGVKSEWRKGKNVYVEDDTRSFYECGTNRSALVDYLKEFQKSK